jgi:hypothetical protein
MAPCPVRSATDRAIALEQGRGLRFVKRIDLPGERRMTEMLPVHCAPRRPPLARDNLKP